LLAAFGGSLPPVMWDGLGSIHAVPGTRGWSLNLAQAGQGLSGARPAPLDAPVVQGEFDRSGIGAPDELEARITG